MGVSYQAVSNWERGNSMPDISKLEDLCKTLDLSVEELLGMETKTAAAVNQVLHNEPLTVEELKEVAPILPPEQMKEKTEETEKEQKINLEDVTELAPFLEEDYVENLVSGIVRGVTESAVGNARKYAQAGLDAARKAASSYQLPGSIFVHLQQDLEELFLLIGRFGGKKFIALKRDISAAIILSSQLLKQLGHGEVECGGDFLNAFNGCILFAPFQLTDICGVATGQLSQLLLAKPGPCPVISDSLTNSFCDFTHRRNTPFLRYI